MTDPRSERPDNYISQILGKQMQLKSATEELEGTLIRLGGRRTSIEGRPAWVLDFEGESQLASLLAVLNGEGVLLAGGPAGWPPAEILADLRDKGLFQGSFREVTWTGPGKWIIRDR